MPRATAMARKYSPAPPGPETGSSSTRGECLVSAGCDIDPLPSARPDARILSRWRTIPRRVSQAVTPARGLLVDPAMLDEPRLDARTRALVPRRDGLDRG